MRPRSSLFCGAATLALLAPLGAIAAEVRPRGALDIEIGGFFRFLAAAGDLREKRGDNSGSYDFRNDTEVFVNIRATDEATGIEYGVVIELEADTNTTGNADETFMFIRGGFGEFRLGDDDGMLKDHSLGAHTIAVGTGGLDGTILDNQNLAFVGTTNNDSSRIKYYSPRLAGFQLGLGFTPSSNSSGQNIRQTNDGGIDDVIEASLLYRGEFGGVALSANLGAAFGHQNTTNDDAEGYQAGLAAVLFGIRLAGQVVHQELGNDENTFYNIGAATTLGPVGLSVNWPDLRRALEPDPGRGGRPVPGRDRQRRGLVLRRGSGR
jgi:outer membrane protein OmpU